MPELYDRTLRSILEDPLIADIAPDAISNWDLSGEDYYNWTLREIAEKRGWRSLKRGFERLFEAAERGNYYYRLYSDEECAGEPRKERASIVYFPSDDAAADDRPFIFVVPGGGLENVWNLTEGWPVARNFNELGYHAFILTYQVDVPVAALRAMDDFARAMEIIASRRDEFRVRPDRYITCGFSSGGYLVCLWNTEKGYPSFGISRPEMCIPVYANTSYRIMDAEDWGEDADKEGFAQFSVGCSMAEACNSCFEIPEHIEGFPPTFLCSTEADEMVDPENTRRLAAAIADAGIACKTEMGTSGWHGFADGEGMCMEGWQKRAMEWYESLSAEDSK